MSAAEPQPAPSVAVKALEWSDEDNGDFIAQSIVGWYHIGLPHLTWNLMTPNGDVQSFNTLKEAKAAAQADYEARVSSALSAQVQDVAAGVMASIAEERKRQIAKGYDVSHDDAHDTYEIIDASWGAAARINIARSFRDQHNISGYKSALIQAAAQIVAEIERLDRAAAPAKQED